MELKIKNGDYVLSGGMAERLEGSAELIQRVLYKLTARREGFPFIPELGSELYALSRTTARERDSAAELAVREALSDETELEITDVTLRETQEGLYTLQVQMEQAGQELNVSLLVQ